MTVSRIAARGGRTARENLADLTDGGAVSEYGQLAVAAQRSRREGDALYAETAAAWCRLSANAKRSMA